MTTILFYNQVSQLCFSWQIQFELRSEKISKILVFVSIPQTLSEVFHVGVFSQTVSEEFETLT